MIAKYQACTEVVNSKLHTSHRLQNLLTAMRYHNTKKKQYLLSVYFAQEFILRRRLFCVGVYFAQAFILSAFKFPLFLYF